MSDNMSDKELLELAAKAAGIELLGYSCVDGRMMTTSYPTTPFTKRYWTPLTNDGDALRLAVKLGLDINAYSTSQETSACLYREGIKFRCIEKKNDDPYAAARRAIVRAAAEIGRNHE